MVDQNKIAVLPLGAYEYHGPHLPFSTDIQIAQAVVKRAAAVLVNFPNICFLKTEPIGYSVEHMLHRKTKSLSWQKAIKRWIMIGEKCYRAGFKKFVMLNAHGGNSPLMTIVATELRAKLGMLAVASGWLRFGLPSGILSPYEQKFDIHAGFIETSVMLAIAPEQVNMQKAENFENRQQIFEKKFSWLRAYGKHAFGWCMNDLNVRGAAGNATRATAEIGEKILTYAASHFSCLLKDVHYFNLADLACI